MTHLTPHASSLQVSLKREWDYVRSNLVPLWNYPPEWTMRCSTGSTHQWSNYKGVLWYGWLFHFLVLFCCSTRWYCVKKTLNEITSKINYTGHHACTNPHLLLLQLPVLAEIHATSPVDSLFASTTCCIKYVMHIMRSGGSLECILVNINSRYMPSKLLMVNSTIVDPLILIQ